MNAINENTDPNSKMTEKENNFFNKVELPFDKSKDEVWEMMAARLDKKPESRTARLLPGRLWIGLAATILVLAAIFSVMRFYTTTIHNPAGQHLTANLPDGSLVELNAQSTLKYHPLWWRFSREVGFEGEGFFKVQKGKAFKVISGLGRTIVLGTSFNIFSRDEEYKVSCFTGKVKVVSNSEDEAILLPGYHAEVEQKGSIKVFKNHQAKEAVSWRDGMFSFTAVPLIRVIREIERQYAVSIDLNIQKDYDYTGFFSKNKPLEQVLDIICKTFGLTFEKKSDRHYLIKQ